MDIVIVTNSPGEIAGWVTPVVNEIVQSSEFQVPRDRIIIFIPYCQYASGSEKEIAASIPGVNYVFGPQEHLKFLFFNKGIKGGFSKNGILIHLGSDYFHSLLISRRLGYPAIAYTYDVSKFYDRYFEKFLVPNENCRDKLARKGISIKKIEIVGDLFVDAAKPTLSRQEARKLWTESEDDFLVGIFPGSRPYQIKYMIPFFMECANLIKRKFPNVKFILSRPAFISENQIRNAIQNGKLSDEWIITEGGIKIRLVSEMPYNVMGAADLILTIPGTNTAQIASLGCPMIVITPLNKLDEIPLDGIAGYTQLIPFFGKPIKRFLVKRFNDKTQWTAIPNSKANFEVTPEIRGIISPEEVAEKVGELIIDDKRRTEISKRLKEVMGEGGAAKKIAEIIKGGDKNESSGIGKN